MAKYQCPECGRILEKPGECPTCGTKVTVDDEQ